MSINHLVERLNVKRVVPPISFLGDDLSVITHNHLQVAKQSQIGIEAKPTKYEKTLARHRKHWRDYHHRHKERCYAITKKWLKQARTNPEYREYLNKLRKSSYYRCKERVIAEVGVDALREKWRENRRNYIEKLASSMTPSQLKQHKKALNQKRREREIAKCGGVEAYREKKRLINKAYRERKKNGI